MIVDFKFDALYQVSLHRELPEVRLLEELSRSLYWWVELGVPLSALLYSGNILKLLERNGNCKLQLVLGSHFTVLVKIVRVPQHGQAMPL